MMMHSIEKELMKTIESRFNEIAEEEIMKCQSSIRKRMAEITSGVVLNLMEHISVENFGNELRIRVLLPKDNK